MCIGSLADVTALLVIIGIVVFVLVFVWRFSRGMEKDTEGY